MCAMCAFMYVCILYINVLLYISCSPSMKNMYIYIIKNTKKLCVCICMCVYIYSYICYIIHLFHHGECIQHTHMYTHAHIHIYAYMYIHVHTYNTHILTHVHTSLHLAFCIHYSCICGPRIGNTQMA